MFERRRVLGLGEREMKDSCCVEERMGVVLGRKMAGRKTRKDKSGRGRRDYRQCCVGEEKGEEKWFKGEEKRGDARKKSVGKGKS